ncbi:hypothetical protein EE612_055964, partial [Oryza sativa]
LLHDEASVLLGLLLHLGQLVGRRAQRDNLFNLLFCDPAIRVLVHPEGLETAVEAGVGDLVPEFQQLRLADAVAGDVPPPRQRVEQLAGELQLLHPDALAELGAGEEAVLGEVVEALLDGGPAGAAVGAADELEALEGVGGGGLGARPRQQRHVRVLAAAARRLHAVHRHRVVAHVEGDLHVVLLVV